VADSDAVMSEKVWNLISRSTPNPLVRRRDMEADGFPRHIHTNVLFAARLDTIPGSDIRARGFIDFIGLVS
jgi:hypothetical protein